MGSSSGRLAGVFHTHPTSALRTPPVSPAGEERSCSTAAHSRGRRRHMDLRYGLCTRHGRCTHGPQPSVTGLSAGTHARANAHARNPLQSAADPGLAALPASVAWRGPVHPKALANPGKKLATCITAERLVTPMAQPPGLALTALPGGAAIGKIQDISAASAYKTSASSYQINSNYSVTGQRHR